MWSVVFLFAARELKRAVREQDADVVLRIPQEFAESWKKGEPAQVEIVYDDSQRDTSGSVARLRGMLEQYNRQTGAMRLVMRDVGLEEIVPRLMAALRSRSLTKPQVAHMKVRSLRAMSFQSHPQAEQVLLLG